MESTLQHAVAGDSNRAFAVEQHGINLIPETERRGSPADLAWIWAGSNIILTYVIIGGLLATLKLSFGQALGVILTGYLLFALVGYGGVPGARAGTATMVISRAAFGRSGNFVPALLSWFTVVGWEAVNIVLGAFALYALFELFGFTLGTTGKAILLAILVVFTFTVAVLGHATIALFQKIFTWALGILVLSIVPQVLQAPSLGAIPDAGASFATLTLAFTLVAAMPVSYANCPAEYARYLPRRSSTGAITFWTFIGAYVPAVIITLIGYFAGTVTDLTDPIAGFKPLLAPWHFALFVIAVIGGSITNNFINTYSSGMSLLAMDLKVSRPTAIILDGILATAVAVYAIFFYDFTAVFIAFLALMVVWIAPWWAVYLVDAWLRRTHYSAEDLVSGDGGRYRYGNGWHRAGYIAWIAGVIVAIACTSADAFKSPFASSFLGGADLGIVAGMLTSGILYWLLARSGTRDA
jgi:purine-cytosine permease-like protein